MPAHIQPVLRAREDAWESFGIYQALDTRGVTIQKAAELAGTVTKDVPKFVVRSNNSSYTPS